MMMENGQVHHVGAPCYYEKWWLRRSKAERARILVVSGSVLAVTMVLLWFLWQKNDPNICTSSACVRTSARLLNYMDIKADPCLDFYRFSCGNFLHHNTNLHNGRGSRSAPHITEDGIRAQIRNMLEAIDNRTTMARGRHSIALAKKFYRACMNESAVEATGLKGMRRILSQIGGWPTLIGNNWRESEFDWKDVLYKLRRNGINFEFFLILSVQKDKANPTRHILTLKNPAYSPSKISLEIRKFYLDYMVDVAVLFGAEKQRARREQNQVMQLLLSLTKIAEEAQAANGSNLDIRKSIIEMEYEFSGMSWLAHINNMLSPAAKLTYEDAIIVANPIYLKRALRLIKTTSKRILANFISWHILQRLINYLPARVQDAMHEYIHKVNGRHTKELRWRMCVGVTRNSLPAIVSMEYVKNYLNDEARHRITAMIRSLRSQLEKKLLLLEWLDADTKNLLVGRLVTSADHIISLEDFYATHRRQPYNDVDISEDQFLASFLNLDYVNTNMEYEKLRQDVTDNLITQPGFATGLRVVFDPQSNTRTYPIGIFQGVYYHNERPEYLNIGAVGSVIAHEISHLITDAELKRGWSTHSLLNYEQRAVCIAKQYGKFSLPRTDRRLNAPNARDEDIADLVGIKVAYDTYINWVEANYAEARLPGLSHSPNQLFWISSAIHHCAKYSSQTLQRHIANYKRTTEPFRFNGILRNMREFANDFQCPRGTFMNPDDKCDIF